MEKIGFFKRIKKAIFKFESYASFSEEKTSKTVGYYAKLICLLVIIICLALTIKFGNVFNKGISYLTQELPEFTIVNNVLTTANEEPLTLSIDEIVQGIIIVDSKTDSEEQIESYKKQLENYSNGAIFLKDKGIVKLETSKNVTEYSYSELLQQYNLEELTKTSLLEKLNNSSLLIGMYIGFFGIMFALMFIRYFAIIILDILMLSIIGYLVTKLYKISFKYLQLLKMAIYALTLPILLTAIYIPINILTGFEITYFQIMYNAVAFIYLVTAILIMKSDVIKQKITVAEETVEIKKTPKEDEEVEKEDKEDKKEEDKKEKKEKKQKSPGGEAEGSKA